ncbi:Choline/ethanolaminephosphotransferase 1 [Nymphon striatum]|nr:Choline/ethanolaminephosphotransferase 1 [Nymphon striatum]
MNINMLVSSPILSPSQLKRLSEHKYSSQCTSFLDQFMQTFWNWLVKQLPLWLAPNAITISGLIVNISTSILLMAYCPNMKSEVLDSALHDGIKTYVVDTINKSYDYDYLEHIRKPPWWTCVLAAVGLFMYQSLDAVDGKQARRTKSSSPLGELFDHGCDSMSTVFVVISLCIVVELGYYPPLMFLQCFLACFMFYVAHWQTYVSGTLRFGKFDVTEAQFAVIGIQLISAIFGSSIWATKIPLIGWELKVFLTVASLFPATYGVLVNLHVVFTGGVGKNGSTVAGSSVLSPFLPICLVLIPAYVIAQKSVSNIFEVHPCLYILTFGLVSAKVSSRLVVAHMSKSEMDCLDSVLIGPGLLFLNQYFDTTINEYIVLWIALVFTILDLCFYCAKVCSEICEYLNIYLFKLSSLKEDTAGVSYNLRSHHAENEADEHIFDEGGTTEPLLNEVVVSAVDSE